MIIKLYDEYKSSLNSVNMAPDLFKQINNSSELEVILDFENVEFITLSFTQEYMTLKHDTGKRIHEINLNEENKTMLNVIAEKYGEKI